MNQEIIKTEKIGYLKSKLNLMQGTLELTPSRLILKAHKTGVGGFGLIGAILKQKVEKKTIGFDMPLIDIKHIEKVKFGVNKNVLEITDVDDNQFKIIVKDYNDWYQLLKN